MKQETKQNSWVMEKFEAYYNPPQNVTWEWHMFNTRNQQAGETIDQYDTDLKTKVKSVNWVL